MTDDPLRARVLAHLRTEYCGVFPDLPDAYERAAEERLSFAVGDALCTRVAEISGISEHARVLDVGCGYGTFVLACLRRGYDAIGIDLESFELMIARERLREIDRNRDPAAVFRAGDGTQTGVAAATFDIVTIWNVLEHVPDPTALLAEAQRLLRPGGFMFVTAPNACAFRREAHYQVPWVPCLPKAVAVRYLRCVGRDPTFYARSVYAVTNRGIRSWCYRNGLRLASVDAGTLAHPERCTSPIARKVLSIARAWRAEPLVAAVAVLRRSNPFASGIMLAAQQYACPNSIVDSSFSRTMPSASTS